MKMMSLKSEVVAPLPAEASGSGTSGGPCADPAPGSFSSSGSVAMACRLDLTGWISVFMAAPIKRFHGCLSTHALATGIDTPPHPPIGGGRGDLNARWREL